MGSFISVLLHQQHQHQQQNLCPDLLFWSYLTPLFLSDFCFCTHTHRVTPMLSTPLQTQTLDLSLSSAISPLSLLFRFLLLFITCSHVNFKIPRAISHSCNAQQPTHSFIEAIGRYHTANAWRELHRLFSKTSNKNLDGSVWFFNSYFDSNTFSRRHSVQYIFVIAALSECSTLRLCNAVLLIGPITFFVNFYISTSQTSEPGKPSSLRLFPTTPSTSKPQSVSDRPSRDTPQSSGPENDSSSSSYLWSTSDTLRHTGLASVSAAVCVALIVTFTPIVFIAQRKHSFQHNQKTHLDPFYRFSSDGTNPPQVDTYSTVLDVSHHHCSDPNISSVPFSPLSTVCLLSYRRCETHLLTAVFLRWIASDFWLHPLRLWCNSRKEIASHSLVAVAEFLHCYTRLSLYWQALLLPSFEKAPWMTMVVTSSVWKLLLQHVATNIKSVLTAISVLGRELFCYMD